MRYPLALANIKIERQRWPAKPLISGRSGTQYVAMVTKVICSYCGAHLLESYCKESSISDSNWLGYLFPSQPSDSNCLGYLFPSHLIIIRLSLWRHHLANLHILKTWISLVQKEIFENSKQHSSRTDYMFMSLQCNAPYRGHPTDFHI